ncbi:MAG: hypothetical protein ACW97X_03675 [Candidatus Hodarchaeales archaeon]|jgi:hypothetical protein
MNENSWLNIGLEELEHKRWFDGYQMLLGAYKRNLQSNDPNGAEKIISSSLPLFLKEKKKKLACDLITEIILSIQRNLNQRDWIQLLPIGISELRKSSLDDCISRVCNKIIFEKGFQDSAFLQHINNIILEKKFSNDVIYHLYYCYVGILCRKKEFILAFESLESWSQEFAPLSIKMRTYLTLAELNAYEISSCGKYLHNNDDEISAISSESKNYIEIAARIFRSVEVMNVDEFLSTNEDYSDIINPRADSLLKALCEGISEIFKEKPSSGLFSLFGA